MALSMDEQRILDEIERCLADEDPRLAARLTSFGRPGFGITLRSRRGRMLASVIALVTLAVITIAAYAVIPLGLRHAPRPRPASSSSSGKPTASVSPATTGQTPAAGPQANGTQPPSR
ncbi:MAG: DUF3040 domain-containing protein [Micromonosporaceae bacterium]